MTRLRASDAEREEVARVLQAAAGEGRLSPEEAGERLAQASAAGYRDELVRLTEDLPAAVVERPEPRDRPAFYPWLAWRLARFAAVAGVVAIVWTLVGIRYFWVMWPLAFMALGVLRGPRRRYWYGPWRGAFLTTRSGRSPWR